ncbi:hypothetical protein J4477_04640 [Candidatus Pacearchaeota archaeon]|nr:hypothetical protein [Candidatus Pacearchaeota archaeon]
MVCKQRKSLEQISKAFNLASLSDSAFFALVKHRSNVKLKKEDLAYINEAIRYMDLVNQGYKLNEELNNRGAIHPNTQAQLEAFNLYLQFARKNKVADIPASIKSISDTLEKVRKKETTEAKALEYTESLFSHLLRYSLGEFDEAIGYK